MFFTPLYRTGGQLPLETPDIPKASTSEEGEQYSLYDTDESEPEEALEMKVNNDGDALIESLEDMKCFIAALDATQTVIVDKLATLEKLVSCVHKDIT